MTIYLCLALFALSITQLKKKNKQKKKKWEYTITVFFSVIRQFFFPLKKNSKILDPSYKMKLDLWDCLERVKLQKNFVELV